MDCRPVTFKGIPGHLLKDRDLEVIVTDYGAKVQSIRYCGREFLHQNQNSEEYRITEYGSSFYSGEFSGMDEMFPNISAGLYPEGPWQGAQLPDHGEVWTLCWSSDVQENGLHFSVDGVVLPYRLEKTMWLEQNAICLRYQAENMAQHEMKCIWAAHPLFVLEDGMELVLPYCKQIINVYGGQKYLGEYGQVYPWPVSGQGRAIELLDGRYKCCNKYYVYNQMKRNVSLLHYPSGTTVAFEAPVSQVPYLGIWTDEDGDTMTCAALEPCTGAYDTVEKAVEMNAACTIAPGGQHQWSLRISFSQVKKS